MNIQQETYVSGHGFIKVGESITVRDVLDILSSGLHEDGVNDKPHEFAKGEDGQVFRVVISVEQMPIQGVL